MCIVIDTNTWASVFDIGADDHIEFKPVYDWILGDGGKGKIVYGGTTYLQEVPSKYMSLLLELNKRRKTVAVENSKVDEIEIKLKKLIEHRDFDDPHIVALIIVSKCKLICTKEKRAIPFFKDKKGLFYPKKFIRPKIYNNKTNIDLLVDKNIISICQPCKATTKTEAQEINKTVQQIIIKPKK
jgi:hypothetical protein